MLQFGQHVTPVISLLHPARDLTRFFLRRLQFFIGPIKLVGLGFEFLDLRLQILDFIFLRFRQFLKEEPNGARHRHQAQQCEDEIRFLFVESPPAQRAARHQIHFHRAIRQIPQSQADHFAQRVCHARQLLQIHRRINLYVAERIEVFDRHIQLFREKLRRIRHDGRAAGQKQTQRRRPALLSAIKLHRLVELDVQLGHELPRDFGNGRLVLTFRLLVSTAETDEAFGNFFLFGDFKF